MERIARTIVNARDAGTPLIDFISKRFTYLPASDWAEAVTDGIITVNGRKAPPGARLSAGDVLLFAPGGFEEPEVDAGFSIAYEDEDALVVDKPGNLPVHPGGRFFKRTLWYLLRESGREVRIVTRLDRETSGLVLIAKTSEEARRLQTLQSSGGIDKRYEVLVHGRFPGSLTARGILVPDKASTVLKKRAYIDENDPRYAAEHVSGENCETLFSLIDASDSMSLVSARLVTGRTHQIRATLRSLGFPVVGDKLYGVDETLFLRFVEESLGEADRKLLILPRQALHCRTLSFTARYGEEKRVRSPSPFGLPRSIT